MFQIVLTPAAGKRLITKAVCQMPDVKRAIAHGTVVIIAGTTNGYVAQELLAGINQIKDFNPGRFFRGVTVPPNIKTTETGRLQDDLPSRGDIVIVNGRWEQELTIFDVVNKLGVQDVIIKGANCIDILHKKAGILIGHPEGGTIIAALTAVIGKRATLILPAGLEKRVIDDIDMLARLLNTPDASGLRLMPVTGNVISEIEAIDILFGLRTHLMAGGGVGGAEGAVWLAISGDPEKEPDARTILKSIANEKPFVL